MENCFRSPESIMDSSRLGAFSASYLSFSRRIVRVMIAEKWKITQTTFNIDAQGIGKAVYKLVTPKRIYSIIFFSQNLDSAQRNDRVIATAWDMCFCLFNGEVSNEDIIQISQNLPFQEKGRYHRNILCISRANKSVRNFQYIVNCLAEGINPDIEQIKKTGYLARTTAVYGNGKFGMADYKNLQETDFSEQFQVQMFTVYVARIFTIDLVEHLAKQKNPKKYRPLNNKTKRFIGVGNSTGLGMIPFLIKHPQVVHSWIVYREKALYQIFNKKEITENSKKKFHTYWQKAIIFFETYQVPDAKQQNKNNLLKKELKKYQNNLLEKNWLPTWRKLEKTSLELQELFLNILLEIYPQTSQKFSKFPLLKPNKEAQIIEQIATLSVAELILKIQKNYSWAIKVDFSKPESQQFFWYRSEEKEEPRLGDRYKEQGVHQEMKINIAYSIKQLYQALQKLKNKQKSLVDFLFSSPKFSAQVKRILHYEFFPYGEIRSNMIDKKFYPIDILRLKLSFFGAVKFDPKSNRWLRITLFQGAPLLDKQGYIEKKDDSFLSVS